MRFPNTGFIKGSLFSLVSILPKVALPTERIDDLGDSVAKKINAAAYMLERDETR